MRRAIFIVILLFLIPLAFLPGDVSSSSPCSSSLSPPFVASGVKPNILIILDNSNSMDEDFYGNAVGSYAASSKSVVARQALQTLVSDLTNKADVGVMTYGLPSDVQSYNIHNSMPFASYDPNSYCPNAPQDCVTYCATGDSTAKSNCDAACGSGFTSHVYATTGTNFPDAIITYYPAGNATRAKYCGLVYPKTQRMANPADPSNYIYWNQADPMYSSSNLGTMYGYCGTGSSYSYSPAEQANNTYRYRSSKTGQSDAYVGYSGSTADYTFQPTDSDWALGFYNFGQRMPWYYVGPTWFSTGGASASPQGYLHVPAGDLSVTTQFNNVYNILAPHSGDSAGYMSCTTGNKNACSYIINASNTPTAGTLNAALNYFNGKLQYTDPTTQKSTTKSPITSLCQKNYIIYVTDGMPSTMMNGTQTTNISQLMPEVLTQLTNLQTTVSQTISGTSQTFPVKTYVLGVGLTDDAKTNLDQMAAAGGTATTSGHAYYADQPSDLIDALETIITDLLGRVAAGSSISILSEGQTQNGANMLQGVFYPTKYFGATAVNWPGYLYEYWFYNSQSFSNIREDTLHDYILELDQDYGISFDFDPQLGLSVNRYSDPAASGNPSTFVDNVQLDSLTPIWEAGKLLFQTTAAGRQIYTPGSDGSGGLTLVNFNTSNTTLTAPTSSPLGTPSTFDPCLQGSSNTVTLQNLINYVRGTDITNCRNRTVGLCSNGTAFNNTPCGSNSDCTTSPYTTCTKNVWKLGDIVYSTPQVQMDYQYCSNGSSFSSQLCSQDSDCTSGAFTSCQKKESVVFAGANDGMLHAFKTGVLSSTGLNLSSHQIEALTGISTSDMGKELWAFIPTNSLPYLRCLAVPPPGSCHLYYNDLSPYITTMVSNGVVRKVLIGGMRLGGGAISTGKYCFNSSGVSNGTACTQTSDCPTHFNSSCSTGYYLNAPTDTCSSSLTSSTPSYSTAALCSNPAACFNPTNCTGLSEYYALDITDAENPQLLWEFTHPFLGYTYSGPAVIHKWSDPTQKVGDQYYVMFLSGPTNPADGSSIQDVQVFVLTLNANLGISNSSLYYKDLGSTTANGFGGRLFTTGLDKDGDGYTDFVFFGYANSPTGSTTGWKGGLGKINTNNTDPSAALDPKNWTYDISTYSSIVTLPVTAQVTVEQCWDNLYLYAGTGRYFFPLDNYGGSGDSGLNYLMGIPFTCDQYNNACSNPTALDNSSTACTNLQHQTYGQAGWEYQLNGAAGTYLAERLTTDPTKSAGNKIYFTTSEPTSDPCSYGGQSRVWGLNCATGGAITDTSCSGFTVTDLSGTVYLQTSTGAIYQINAASSFTDSSTGNRTTQWFIGMPPETSPPVVQPTSSQTKSGQLIQWIEK